MTKHPDSLSKILSILVVCFSLFGLSGCKREPGGLVVTVVDQHGTPISGADTTIMPPGTVSATNFEGEYRAYPLPARDYTIEIAKPGFKSTSRKIVINSDATSTIRIAMAPIESLPQAVPTSAPTAYTSATPTPTDKPKLMQSNPTPSFSQSTERNENSGINLVSGAKSSTPTVWAYYVSHKPPLASWKDLDFPEDDWQKGIPTFGFGDKRLTTTLPSGRDYGNVIPTTYFRTIFDADAKAIKNGVRIDFVRDDGLVIYLNGIEVIRDNMPDGEITHETLASGTIGGGAETSVHSAHIPGNRLRQGKNVLAVELHQASATSSDLKFDCAVVLELFQ